MEAIHLQNTKSPHLSSEYVKMSNDYNELSINQFSVLIIQHQNHSFSKPKYQRNSGKHESHQTSSGLDTPAHSDHLVICWRNSDNLGAALRIPRLGRGGVSRLDRGDVARLGGHGIRRLDRDGGVATASWVLAWVADRGDR